MTEGKTHIAREHLVLSYKVYNEKEWYECSEHTKDIKLWQPDNVLSPDELYSMKEGLDVKKADSIEKVEPKPKTKKRSSAPLLVLDQTQISQIIADAQYRQKQ